MIDCVYYNDDIRCYRDGRVERFFRNCYWRIIENTANSKKGYNRVEVNKILVQRHRLIACCFIGLENIIGNHIGVDLIDHIDRNPLNNAVENLRITNCSGNNQNRSSVKGYIKKCDKYQARIVINNTLHNLGSYKTKEEAHQAYLEGKEKYHLL